MARIHSNRIAIIGAGSVGATIAYAAMIRGVTRQIVLSDLDAPKAEAEAKDLVHGSMFVPEVEVWSGTVEDCAGSAAVIVTAGAKQEPGQSRLDLAASNVELYRTLIPSILKAAPGAILLIVSNPVDVLTYVTAKITSIPPVRIIGSGTVLDTSRFRSLLAKRLRVAVGNVHAYIVGEHGDSEVPLWSSADIAGVPIGEFRGPGVLPLSDAERQELFRNVRDAAAKVIQAKGATNWAVGLAVARILEALLRDENRVFTVSSLLKDYHGISDVCLSVPRILSGEGVSEAIPVRLSDEELKALRDSANAVKQAAKKLGF